jgi:glutamate carboxypeptidase
MTDYQAGTTVSVGVVSGGTRSNVVPSQAKALVDLRVRTAAEGRRMDEAILGLRPVLPGARLEVTGALSRPPMEESPVTLKPFKRAQAIAAEMGIRLGAGGTGGASDGNFSAALGAPTLDGLGALGDGAHGVDEYVLVSSLAERGALLAALLSRW